MGARSPVRNLLWSASCRQQRRRRNSSALETGKEYTTVKPPGNGNVWHGHIRKAGALHSGRWSAVGLSFLGNILHVGHHTWNFRKHLSFKAICSRCALVSSMQERGAERKPEVLPKSSGSTLRWRQGPWLLTFEQTPWPCTCVPSSVHLAGRKVVFQSWAQDRPERYRGWLIPRSATEKNF